jgi:AcrR family transcriptional regulator
LRATLASLAEHGYDGLTVERIARRAGVGRGTIYRRWSAKEELVVAAAQRLSEAVPAPDTGTLRGDLDTIADGLTAVFSAPTTASIVATLLPQMASNDALADALRRGFLAARRTAARNALERARSRGELRRGANADVAIDLLAAPFYYRLLISGDLIHHAFARNVVDAVMAYASNR